MGTPGTSLREEESAMLQKRVDELGAQFRATVRAGVARRSAMTGRALTISDDLMQGQSFTAAAARAAGLIDELTTFDVALADARELGKHRPVTKKG
jgi:ClpP class serine protease